LPEDGHRVAEQSFTLFVSQKNVMASRFPAVRVDANFAVRASANVDPPGGVIFRKMRVARPSFLGICE